MCREPIRSLHSAKGGVECNDSSRGKCKVMAQHFAYGNDGKRDLGFLVGMSQPRSGGAPLGRAAESSLRDFGPGNTQVQVRFHTFGCLCRGCNSMLARFEDELRARAGDILDEFSFTCGSRN